METPLSTNWEYGQLPVAHAVPQAFTPNPHVAAASTWPGLTPPARSPMSDRTSGTYDVVIPEPTVSQLPTTELNNPLPRMNM
eukprot:3065570-Prorocentrum_lima.AAC.1